MKALCKQLKRSKKTFNQIQYLCAIAL
ncbi:hypothetical protein [Nostoc sphaeroides]